MPKMKAVQVARAGGPFEIVSREVPEPGPGEVRLRVAACGICHSDAFVKEGHLPGVTYPRVPGHEIAGTIDTVGAGVSIWKAGDRAGVGWHGGHCSVCPSCREGDFANCDRPLVTGASFDGGYAEYAVVPEKAVARIPDALGFPEAAPLLCAGITTYNALRHSGARGGDLVAVQGIGGLGHLGIQFAKKLGFRTVAISASRDKEALARTLGADHFIDARATGPAEALQKLGGARVILATAPDARSITGVLDGLGPNGTLLIVAASPDTIEVSPIKLLRGRRSVRGWASGHARDSEDTMSFCALSGVRPMIEPFPLAKVQGAFERMISNRARFRVVLRIGE